MPNFFSFKYLYRHLGMGLLLCGINLNSLPQDEADVIYTFRARGDSFAEKMIVVGESHNKEKAITLSIKNQPNLCPNNAFDCKPLGKIDTRPDSIVFQAKEGQNLRIGQVLYLLEKPSNHKENKEATIIGEVVIRSIFQSAFLGTQVRAEGNLHRIGEKVITVAKRIEGERLEDALEFKRQGDFYFTKREIEQALAHYKKAVSLDGNFPLGHYSLAKLHLNGGEGYRSAEIEFELAWKKREGFKENHDKYLFLQDYIVFLLSNRGIQEEKKRVSRVPKLLQLIEENLKLAPDQVQTLAIASEIYFRAYQEMLIDHSSEGRKKRETYLDKVGHYLEKSYQKNKPSFYLYRTALKYYHALLDPTQNESNPTKEEVKNWKLAFIKAKELYKVYHPPAQPLDEETKAILSIEF